MENETTQVTQETQNTQTPTTPTFDEMLGNKEYQGEFDRRIAKAIETAKGKWQQEQADKQSEAEKLAKMKAEERFDYEIKKEREISANAIAELEAYRLKDETIKQANEKGLPIELVNFIDFKGSNAESISAKLDTMSNAFNTAVQKALELKLQQKTPTQNNGGTTVSSEKAYMDEKYKNNPWYNK